MAEFEPKINTPKFKYLETKTSKSLAQDNRLKSDLERAEKQVRPDSLYPGG